MRLYFRYLGLHVKSAMQHKASFFMLLFGQAITALAGLMSVYWLLDRFGSVQGFGYEEILICYCVVLMGFSIAECFARGFDQFPHLISDGRFDRMLVRPRGEVFQVLASTMELNRAGRLIEAAAVLAYTLPNCGVDWTGGNIALLIFMIVGATALFGGLFWINAGLSFFATEGLEVMNVFTDGSREHGAYPVVVYGREALRFYTFVVPLACVQYYPLLYLTGRSDDIRLALTPLAGMIFLLPAYVVWRVGLRHYRSTGS